MSKNIKPYKDSELGKKEQVAQMFDNISGNYDGLNKVISFGTDAKWKQKILKMVTAQQPNSILDIATGTGDLAILFASTSAKEIIGLDISQGMLEIGKKKIAAQNLESKIQMVLGDGENVPYPDNYFDTITVAYGVRNFENLEKGLSEILRNDLKSFSARVSAVFQGTKPSSYSLNKDFDRFNLQFWRWDASIRQGIGSNWSLFLNLNNYVDFYSESLKEHQQKYISHIKDKVQRQEEIGKLF